MKLFWLLRFRFIFSSNEDDLSHSTRMTFPGSIKGRAITLSVSSSLILAAEQTNINMRRALSKLQFGCFIPVLTSATAFFPLYDSQYRVFSQAVIKVFGNSSIFSSTHLFYSFLNVTGQVNQFAQLLKWWPDDVKWTCKIS